MRNIIFTIATSASLLVLVNQPMQAQIEQDQWMIGAVSNISVRSTSRDNSSDQKSLNLTIKFGYFFQKNLAAGLDIGVTHLEVGGSSSTDFNIGPFARYYFKDRFFAGMGYSLVFFNQEADATSLTDTGGSFSMEIGSPIWVLIESLSIEPTLRYNIGAGDLLKGTNSLSLNIGFVLYF
ncbi:hypothetical protein [Roseivirga sp. E12]|uniref:hypothetical protein n=1 Tax=Roseivirga sp. E12 TaxID=2819237 RepID=UPI001ABD19C5|nr:hypothetical protein [Roseivirga sp. E12]MBO3700862.1 hypothetical protein [Roseivirga sp. E12]